MDIDALPTNDDWDEDDWREVFPATLDAYTSGDYSGTYEAGPAGGRIDDVTAERIERVIHWHAESPEGYGSRDFYAVVELTDGQYAMCEAQADTTGWGCRADAQWKVGPTYESALGELSQENRRAIEAGEQP